MGRQLTIAGMVVLWIGCAGAAWAAWPPTGCTLEVTLASDPDPVTSTVPSEAAEATSTVPSDPGAASATELLPDDDCDGVPEVACAECTPRYPQADNCPDTPNGPDLGTCTVGWRVGSPCLNDRACGAGGVCSRGQEDADADGFGDACDVCAGDGAYDTDSDGWCDAADSCPFVPNADDQDAADDLCPNGLDRRAPVAAFRGSWFAIGRQVAHTFPDNIIQFGQLMQTVLAAAGPANGWTPARYYREIHDLVPASMHQHLAGMATGLAEVRPISYRSARDLVLAQNFAVDLLNMAKNMDPLPELRGCTGFGLLSAAGAFLCHNTDSQSAGGNLAALMYWAPDNGRDYRYLTFDPPGWVDVSYGLNERGIGVTLNAGNPNTVDAAIGLAPQFMLRMVMERAATLAEARSMIVSWLDSSTYSPTGSILHIMDFNTNEMCKIEVRSQEVQVTEAQAVSPEQPAVSWIASANHFVGDFNPDPAYYYESSWRRYARVLALLPELEDYGLAGCWTIMSDTTDQQNPNNNISRGGGFGQSVTNFGTIFTGEGIYYALGQPHAYLARHDAARYVPLAAIDDPVGLRAVAGWRGVRLSWATPAADAGISGFNLYRARIGEGAFARVNEDPLPATTTTYTDRAGSGRGLYRIEAVMADGTRVTHGTARSRPWWRLF